MLLNKINRFFDAGVAIVFGKHDIQRFGDLVVEIVLVLNLDEGEDSQGHLQDEDQNQQRPVLKIEAPLARASAINSVKCHLPMTAYRCCSSKLRSIPKRR